VQSFFFFSEGRFIQLKFKLLLVFGDSSEVGGISGPIVFLDFFHVKKEIPNFMMSFVMRSFTLDSTWHSLLQHASVFN